MIYLTILELNKWKEKILNNHKCIVQVGDAEDNNICGREATDSYEAGIRLDDGRIVEERLYLCSRHTQVFQEFLNDQGSYQ